MTHLPDMLLKDGFALRDFKGLPSALANRRAGAVACITVLLAFSLMFSLVNASIALAQEGQGAAVPSAVDAGGATGAAHAQNPNLVAAPLAPASQDKAVRTVMLYLCGSDLETNSGAATYNLCQILGARFSSDEDVRFVVMTGGALKWHLEGDRLVSSSGESVNEISTEYNQIWEAKGADAPTNPGKLMLVDADGVSGDGASAKKSEDELMSKPETLQAFIKYCVDNYPAEKYDLIMWDHGSGPSGGFGIDSHDENSVMETSGLLKAFSDNAVTQGGGRFDFINFDACLMGNIECALMFAPYAEYYIASPETIPGLGEDYTGWLNTVGATPDIDTYTLGKQMVDDFHAFYTTGPGAGGRATLAVTDNDKLLESGIVPAMCRLSTLLAESVCPTDGGAPAFYDEIASARSSIRYGQSYFCDLSGFVSTLGVAIDEAKLDSSGSDVDTTTEYTPLVSTIEGILRNEDISYSRSTSNMIADPAFYRKADGSMEYGELVPCAFSVTFPVPDNPLKNTAHAAQYLEAMRDAVEAMPQGDRRTFIEKHVEAVSKYAFTEMMGKDVTDKVNEGVARDALDYAALNVDSETETALGAGQNPAQWADPIVRQQAGEAISKNDVTSKDVELPGGTGHEITIAHARKRVIASVDEDVALELPARDAYLAAHPDEAALFQRVEEGEKTIGVGSHNGVLLAGAQFEGGSGDDFAKSYIAWLYEPESSWLIMSSKDSWYAVKDSSGNLHVASIDEGRTKDELVVSTVMTDAQGASKLCVLTFRKKDDGAQKLEDLLVYPSDGDMNASRPVAAKDLEGTFSFTTVQLLDVMADGGQKTLRLPISKSAFDISSDNADSIELVYVPVDELQDVADAPGGGKALSRTYSVKDIYGAVIDITEKVENPTGIVDPDPSSDDPGKADPGVAEKTPDASHAAVVATTKPAASRAPGTGDMPYACAAVALAVVAAGAAIGASVARRRG